MAKAKGSTLLGAVMALRKRKAEARRVLAEPLHLYLTERVVTSHWYPEEDLLALIRALVELMPGSRAEILRQMGAATAQSLGEGLYHHLMEGAGSAATTFALWATMHDTGKLTSRADAETHEVVFELEGFAAPSEELCAITGAFIEESLRMSGRALTVRKECCVLEGADRCRWRSS